MFTNENIYCRKQAYFPLNLCFNQLENTAIIYYLYKTLSYYYSKLDSEVYLLAVCLSGIPHLNHKTENNFFTNSSKDDT